MSKFVFTIMTFFFIVLIPLALFAQDEDGISYVILLE